MNKSISILIAGCLVSGVAVAEDYSLSATYKEQTAVQLMDNMDTADADGDGMVSQDEFNEHADRINRQVFTETDTDGDGMLSEDEVMTEMPAEWFEKFNMDE